jgi:hypothetical protein
MSSMNRLAVVCGVMFVASLGVALVADSAQLPTRLRNTVLASTRGAEETDAGDCSNKTLLGDPCGACAPYGVEGSKACDPLPDGDRYQNCDLYALAGCLRCVCQTNIDCGGSAYEYSDEKCEEGEKKKGDCIRKYSECNNANCKVKTDCS